MIPVWQSARPCAERRPRRKNTKAQQRGTARRRSGHIRTHTRRGHWHHFWTGSKSKPESRKVVLRWLHPMLVGRSDEPDTTTVHPVQ